MTYSYVGLLISLVRRDLKLKYKGSIIGFFWSLLNPLTMLVVYTFVFGTIMHSTIPHFPIFIMVGLLPWNFFAGFLTVSTGAFTSNSGIITKVKLPKYIFIFSSLVFNLIIFLMMIIIILVSMPFFGVPYSVHLWLLLVALVLQILFSLGLGMTLATLNVFFHDTGHLVEILLMAWFWLTPVIYQIGAIPAGFRGYVALNPMSFIVNLYQSSVLGEPMFASPIAGLIGIAASLALGLYLYRKYANRIAEWL